MNSAQSIRTPPISVYLEARVAKAWDREVENEMNGDGLGQRQLLCSRIGGNGNGDGYVVVSSLDGLQTVCS